MTSAHDPVLDELKAPDLLRLGDILTFATALPFEQCTSECEPACEVMAHRLAFAGGALALLCQELMRKREEALDAYGDYVAAVGALDSQRKHLEKELQEIKARFGLK